MRTSRVSSTDKKAKWDFEDLRPGSLELKTFGFEIGLAFELVHRGLPRKIQFQKEESFQRSCTSFGSLDRFAQLIHRWHDICDVNQSHDWGNIKYPLIKDTHLNNIIIYVIIKYFARLLWPLLSKSATNYGLNVPKFVNI